MLLSKATYKIYVLKLNVYNSQQYTIQQKVHNNIGSKQYHCLFSLNDPRYQTVCNNMLNK